MNTLTTFLLAGTVLLAVPAIAQEAGSPPATAPTSADTNMEILMQKVKADKKLLVASNMELTDPEAKRFWPLYDAYQKELGEVNQRLGMTIKEYADAFNKGPIPNDTAKKLMNEALAVEEAEVKLKRSYAEKISKVLPAAKTARYLQIETKIRSILKAELAQQIPLVY
jgi:Spy/CpxP family protein refolding chaperone